MELLRALYEAIWVGGPLAAHIRVSFQIVVEVAMILNVIVVVDEIVTLIDVTRDLFVIV